MEFTGLLRKYAVDRPLTEFERDFQLRQKQRLSISPHYQLSVIRMNSCYLESVDKWYGWKGLITAVSLIIQLIINGFMGWGALQWILEGLGIFPSQLDRVVLLLNGIAMMFIVMIFSCGLIWLLRKESFAYTHYPIRFNRKTRMVHVFRTNGTALSVSWDNLFFTLAKVGGWNEWEVQGHVLDADNNTVRETFALSYIGHVSADDLTSTAQQPGPGDLVRAHWEFVRRYMEEGPKEISAQVEFCMPISLRRESPGVSVERVFANFAGAPILIYLAMLPFCMVVGLFRMFAMRTCKVPVWPDEIESQCGIENGDPYAIEGALNGERMPVFPEAALAAMVRFGGNNSEMTRTFGKKKSKLAR